MLIPHEALASRGINIQIGMVEIDAGIDDPRGSHIKIKGNGAKIIAAHARDPPIRHLGWGGHVDWLPRGIGPSDGVRNAVRFVVGDAGIAGKPGRCLWRDRGGESAQGSIVNVIHLPPVPHGKVLRMPSHCFPWHRIFEQEDEAVPGEVFEFGGYGC